MGCTVDTFCFILNLRIGCIFIGVIYAISAIITILVHPGIPAYISIALALIGSASLIFAAVNKNGSTKTRTIAVLIFIGTCIVQVLIKIIGVILTSITWGNGSISKSTGIGSDAWFALVLAELLIGIVLDIYFLVVAFSFYQELK